MDCNRPPQRNPGRADAGTQASHSPLVSQSDPVDLFDHPFWDEVRRRAAVKAMEIRRQGFSGPAMLSYSEPEYGGIVNILERLDKRFKVRPAAKPVEPVPA